MSIVILNFGFSDPVGEFCEFKTNIGSYEIYSFDISARILISHKIQDLYPYDLDYVKKFVFNADKIYINAHGASFSSTSFFYDGSEAEIKYQELARFINSLYSGYSKNKDISFAVHVCYAALPRNLEVYSKRVEDFPQIKIKGELDNLDYTNSLAYNFYTELLKQPNLRNFNIKLTASLGIASGNFRECIADLLINGKISTSIKKIVYPIYSQFLDEIMPIIHEYYSSNDLIFKTILNYQKNSYFYSLAEELFNESKTVKTKPFQRDCSVDFFCSKFIYYFKEIDFLPFISRDYIYHKKKYS